VVLDLVERVGDPLQLLDRRLLLPDEANAPAPDRRLVGRRFLRGSRISSFKARFRSSRGTRLAAFYAAGTSRFFNASSKAGTGSIDVPGIEHKVASQSRRSGASGTSRGGSGLKWIA
jgi:hypothetical protein